VACGFPESLIESLVCQRDGGVLDLRTSDSENGEISKGVLACRLCKGQYRIENGILHVLDHQSKLLETMQSEISVRDAEADTYDEKFSRRRSKEIPPTLEQIGSTDTLQVVEYGCGTGRLTRELQARSILAVDFSIDSLRRMQVSLAPRQVVGRVLADVTTLQLRPQYFDIGVATQVYEHVPTPERRFGFLRNIASALTPGGRLVLSVYHFDARRRIRRLPQEGAHHSGIFFHYFTRSELQRELREYFEIETMKLIDIDLPFVRQLGVSSEMRGGISRLVEKLPGLRQFAHLVIAACRNPNGPEDERRTKL
jgi:SAM-dependent methyltransferase